MEEGGGEGLSEHCKAPEFQLATNVHSVNLQMQKR